MEVGALEGRVIHADGTIVPLTGKPSELLKATKGSRGSETTFTMPAVEVGSIIEYRYQVRYDRYLTAPDWKLQKEYFIHKEHFVFRPSKQFLPQQSKDVGAGQAQLKYSHDNILTDVRFKPVLPAGKTLAADAMATMSSISRMSPLFPEDSFAAAHVRLTGWTLLTPITPDVKTNRKGRSSF